MLCRRKVHRAGCSDSIAISHAGRILCSQIPSTNNFLFASFRCRQRLRIVNHRASRDAFSPTKVDSNLILTLRARREFSLHNRSARHHLQHTRKIESIATRGVVVKQKIILFFRKLERKIFLTTSRRASLCPANFH